MRDRTPEHWLALGRNCSGAFPQAYPCCSTCRRDCGMRPISRAKGTQFIEDVEPGRRLSTLLQYGINCVYNLGPNGRLTPLVSFPVSNRWCCRSLVSGDDRYNAHLAGNMQGMAVILEFHQPFVEGLQVNQTSQDEQREFEEQVRTVARALWPAASFGGSENLGRVEYDGIFLAFDTIHCVEATVSRRQDKAQHDGEKLKKAINYWTGRDDRLAKGWFITKDEPTPQQTEVIRKIDRRITAISFRRFKARLIDVYRYSQLREAMRFGSAVNPNPDDPGQEPYIPITFDCLDNDGSPWEEPFEKSLEYASEGRRFAIIGDYGIGKSMNLREIYFRLTSEAKANRSLNVPIHINLRDHWGQRSPSAAIIQHAEEIGYANSDQLVAAWRAGFVHVLLDGFDEVAAPGWSGDLDSLRSSRRRAVELVRRFVEDTPRGAAVIVAGRRSYFDSTDELRRALLRLQHS